MARKPRNIEPYSLVEVSCRTIGSRFLLKPSKEANELISGVLARSARLYPVDVAAFAALSSHYHGLLVVESGQRLAEFMLHLNSNLALEMGNLYDWRYRLWGSRYSAITISNEEEAQVRRLKYILAAGVKEGLVAKVTDWPGVHCGRHLLEGKKLEGKWIDRTYLYRQRRSGMKIDPKEATTIETLSFSKLPCWGHLSPEEYQERVADLIEQAQHEAAVIRQAEGRKVVGRKAILRKSAHFAPAKQKKSRRPLFFAASKEAYKRLVESFSDFLSAYLEASARLRSGHRDTVFPDHCFPPGLSFTGSIRAGPRAGPATALT
jgi:putative transposase